MLDALLDQITSEQVSNSHASEALIFTVHLDSNSVVKKEEMYYLFIISQTVFRKKNEFEVENIH